ncbi:RsfA family transcriptional regulator [Caldibacillus debilis]|uniref:Myb-like domain-containing protein n=1 Tax=Caldibacillus debilis TaxID=301148 RepID=A0A150M5P8_9BACI|nr:RsfA family transcriptional regulator [Caldibacillus debilis]KYD19937.1 hypothetical protein B4135_0836 [Caldibacillus debilis]
MKVRQDAWTEENDLLLAETVLRHVREGSTQLNAFEEVGDKLNRTSAACGFRWNAVVRKKYEKALELAKKQRKQRQRYLGKDHSGKKKLLYQPPMPSEEELKLLAAPAVMDVDEAGGSGGGGERPQDVSHPGESLTLPHVIQFLQNLHLSTLQSGSEKLENERLKRENEDLKKKAEELENKIKELEREAEAMKEDYETIMKIMNRARKLVLFEEEERPATTFKMDKNGNLEKMAE